MLLQLVHGGDDDAIRLVDDYDWYLAPVLNPDGYSFTFTDVCTPAFLLIIIMIIEMVIII